MRHCCRAPRVFSGGAAGLEECEQDRQRQALVIGHRKLIETKRQPWMPGQRAVPLVVLVDEAAKLPFRQLELDQRKGRIGPSTGIDQLTDPCLGSSAAIWGGWLERVGPRKAGVVSALCWCGGLLIGSAGVLMHQLWLLLLGPGIIGGIGLGLGYISPVSTLIKWFPDRRGMATGLAIMGFGGGAMIGAPLADILMNAFRSATSVGAWQTLATMAAIYSVFMLAGAFGYRLPPAGWRPEGWTPPDLSATAMITTRHVHFKNAHKTPQFWLLWAVLCLNVSAGIGVIGMASPMLQEIFGGSLIGQAGVSFTQLDAAQRGMIAAIAAGFTGLLSLFNIGGRLFWAALSDKIGRKTTYCIFFVLGIALYAAVPWTAHSGNKALFVGIFCIIVSMYGGAFATIPAYLADLFGTQFVSAIHGRLLTAWSTAGIIGPVVVNYLREFELAAGVARESAYDLTMYILAAMLVFGLIANQMVKPLADHWFMTDKEVAALQARSSSVTSIPRDRSASVAALSMQGRPGLDRSRHPDALGRLDHARKRVGSVPLIAAGLAARARADASKMFYRAIAVIAPIQSNSDNMKAIVSITSQALATLFQVPVVVMLVTEGTAVSIERVGDVEPHEAELEAARSSLATGTVMRAGVYPDVASRFDFWPLKTAEGRNAVIEIRIRPGRTSFGARCGSRHRSEYFSPGA